MKNVIAFMYRNARLPYVGKLRLGAVPKRSTDKYESDRNMNL